VLDAEALLLVDDDEPEVLELRALRQQAVGADDDVDRRPSSRRP
jgi:hypothetical protein